MRALLITGTLLATASPCLAAVQLVNDVETRSVGYADLDLTTSAGVDRLNRRVDSAARNLCDEGLRLDLEGQRAKRRCLDGARADANGQISVAVARATDEKLASSTLSGR